MANRLFGNVKKLLQEIQEIFLFRGLYRRSYSQEGEDIILDRIFDQQKSGFYVDVGAHHPVRFSNTFLFYKRGWRGVCIDPSQEAIRLFKCMRPRDVSLEMGVSDLSSTLTYIMFDEPALNTFSQELADQRLRDTAYKIITTRQVPVKPLAQILNEVHMAGMKIDFMTIDVEGFDLQVLRSNDWSRYRPRIILAEALSDDAGNSIRDFMSTINYKVIARTFNTEFYEDTLSAQEHVS